jgi:hypothetical protein
MRAFVVPLAFALASIASLPSASAQLGDVQTDLAGVREQILYASYPDAIAAAQRLLARTDLSAADRNVLLELLATAQIANRETDAARVTLSTLYARDPGHRLDDPDASPPVVSAFARAREAHPAAVAVSVEHSSPGVLATRESPVIVARLTGAADAVHEIRLAYRHSGEPGFTRVVLNRRDDGTWSGRIPVVGSTTSAIDVVYYLTAVAPSGAELATRGTESDPLSLRIPADAPDLAIRTDEPPRGGDVASEPWLWVLIGTVVVGAGVGIGVGVALGSQGPEQGTLGIVMLMH